MNTDLEEQIRMRAYEIWEVEGCPAGRELEHWTRAMTELAISSKATHKAKASPKKTAASKRSPAKPQRRGPRAQMVLN